MEESKLGCSTLLCAVVAALMTSSSLSGCAHLAVNIDREPPTIERKYLDKAAVQRLIKDEGREAHTDWIYACKSDLDFHVEKKQSSYNFADVTLRITNVNVVLSLPIVIWTVKDADQSVVSHEEGHAQICKRIYEDAERAARLAADLVIGKTYHGQGDTIEQACQQAVDAAASDMHENYQKQTLEVANRISETYDRLCDDTPDDKEIAADLVQKAFDEDMRSAPRRIK